MNKIMETLDSIGIKLCWLHWKNSREYRSLFYFIFLTLFIASVNGLQIVISNSSYENAAKWKTCQIFKEDRFLVRV